MICLIAVLAFYPALQERHMYAFSAAHETCEEIAERAERAKIDPVLVIAVAGEESRFRRDVESSSGALGPLQIMPAYWCPARGACNLIDAGITALKYYLKREKGDEFAALKGYAGAGERARLYARRVSRRIEHIRTAVASTED